MVFKLTVCLILLTANFIIHLSLWPALHNPESLLSKMPSLRIHWPRLAFGLVLCLAIALVQAEVSASQEPEKLSPGVLSLEQLDDQLQVWHRHLLHASNSQKANLLTLSSNVPLFKP